MFDALPPADPVPDVIVVTGKALPDEAAERGFHVDVVDRQHLLGAASPALDGLLLRLPGLQYFRRSGADSAHPTSQGVTLRALGGNASSRAVLLLDGVPQTDPFGGWINWPAYDPAGLEEVRLLRGGGSVTHGPGALAGAIEMRSFTGSGMAGSAEAGSRGSVIGRLYSGATTGAGRLTLNAQLGRSDGFIPITRATRGAVDRPAPYREANLRGRWIIPLASAVEAQFGGLAFIDERERGVPFTDNRTRGADASLRLVGSGAWQWSVLGYAQWRHFSSSFASIAGDRASASRVALQHVPSRGMGGSVELRPQAGPVDIRLGADLRWVRGESDELYSYVAGEATRRRLAGGESATKGLFAQAGITAAGVDLTAALRIDHWRIGSGELVERLIVGGPPTRDENYPTRSGWQPTARLSAIVGLDGGASLRAAAYRGWRLPALNELFRPFRAGADATAANALLLPEKLSGVEAGFGLRRDGLDFSLTLFANRLADAIANVTLGQGPGIFPGVGFVAGSYRQRQNLRAIMVKGIEASLALRKGHWSLEGGASLTDATVESSSAAAALDGLRPAQTPSLVLAGSLGWQDGDRTLSLSVHHSGSQFEDDLNLDRLAPATTFGAFASWPIGTRLQLVARGQNLLNEQVVAGLADDGSVERASPRTLMIGLRYRSP